MPDVDPGPLPSLPPPPRARDARQRMPGALAGIGVDAESVERFAKLAAAGRFWRHVCSPREAGFLASQAQPALAFCAAFCCKEAFCKALGETFAFPECECWHRPGASELDLVLSPRLRERHGLAAARARFHERFLGECGECVVEVHLFRGWAMGESEARTHPAEGPASPRLPASRLESIVIASVEAERNETVERHFSCEEIGDLGRRRVQSLAGFLALKRALAALWVDAGLAVSAEPRGFEIAHRPSGAPRLVAAPAGAALADVFVSISHTRQRAYGLAALRGRRAAG